jgi:AraC-like DNA-binding protein
MLASAFPSSANPKVRERGPGFHYHWNDGHEPVLITFIPEGTHETPAAGTKYHLFLGVAKDGLSVKSIKHPPQFIKLLNPSHQQQLDEIIGEARICMASPSSDECDNLSFIVAAQRLIALGRLVHANDHNGRKPAKTPAKHQFAADLHEWLSGQLENLVKLDDTAKHFKKSPRQLIRILKETTGSGFAEHLTMHRLTLARTLLMRTDISIMEVAKKSGFNSREQFIRSFSKAFSWTPLQFRKAWNKASRSNSDLKELCQMTEREPVSWHSDLSHAISQETATDPRPHTLVVANALHEIVELFSIDEAGKRTRAGVLDRGAMEFISRDTSGSKWLVRSSGSKFERIFETPVPHAIAVVSSDL